MLALIDGDPFVYAAAWGRDFEGAKRRAKELLVDTVESTFCDDYMVAMGSKFNFRDVIYPLYKKSPSRMNTRKAQPDWFYELKDYICSFDNVRICYGYEADDQLRMWANEAIASGDPYTVCSSDKDLDCIPGNHYNAKKNETYLVTPAYATNFYWQQLLMGDGVDNIPGLPGIGPKTAEKLLLGKLTHEDCRDTVIDKYIDVYGTGWEQHYLANGKMTHMWRFMNDHFTLDT